MDVKVRVKVLFKLWIQIPDVLQHFIEFFLIVTTVAQFRIFITKQCAKLHISTSLPLAGPEGLSGICQKQIHTTIKKHFSYVHRDIGHLEDYTRDIPTLLTIYKVYERKCQTMCLTSIALSVFVSNLFQIQKRILSVLNWSFADM